MNNLPSNIMQVPSCSITPQVYMAFGFLRTAFLTIRWCWILTKFNADNAPDFAVL